MLIDVDGNVLFDLDNYLSEHEGYELYSPQCLDAGYLLLSQYIDTYAETATYIYTLFCNTWTMLFGSWNRRMKMKKCKPRIKIIAAVLVVAIVALIVVLIVKNTGSDRRSSVTGHIEDQVETYPTMSPEEVKAFYQSYGEVISITPANKAKGLLTETEALAILRERGFDQSAVTCPFAVEGIGQWDGEASESSDARHPTYETTYLTEDFTLWHVYLNGDCLLATSPVINVRADAGVIYSEQEHVICYDTNTGSLYEVAPNASGQELRLVERIDADLLEKETSGKEDVQ